MTSEGPDMAGGGGQQVGAEQDYAGDSPPQSPQLSQHLQLMQLNLVFEFSCYLLKFSYIPDLPPLASTSHLQSYIDQFVDLTALRIQRLLRTQSALRHFSD